MIITLVNIICVDQHVHYSCNMCVYINRFVNKKAEMLYIIKVYLIKVN